MGASQCLGTSATPQLGPIQHTSLVSSPTLSKCIGRLQCAGIAVSKPHFSHFNFVAIAISFFSGTSLRACGGVEELGGAAPGTASISARTARNFRGPVKLSSSALLTTLTLDSAIASPARAGFSMIPNHGYKTPAAIGIPSAL